MITRFSCQFLLWHPSAIAWFQVCSATSSGCVLFFALAIGYDASIFACIPEIGRNKIKRKKGINWKTINVPESPRLIPFAFQEWTFPSCLMMAAFLLFFICLPSLTLWKQQQSKKWSLKRGDELFLNHLTSDMGFPSICTKKLIDSLSFTSQVLSNCLMKAGGALATVFQETDIYPMEFEATSK